MILVVVKNTIRAKYADVPVVHRGVRGGDALEPGNVCFDWYRSVDDPNMYVLVEAFVDRAAGDLHVQSSTSKRRWRSSAGSRRRARDRQRRGARGLVDDVRGLVGTAT